MSERYIRWTAELIDEGKTNPVESGSGRTPEQALERLDEGLRRRVDKARSVVDDYEHALHVLERPDVAHKR